MTHPCEDRIPTLVRAADGTLPVAERAALETHIAACAGCAEALADQQSMRGMLTVLAEEPVTTHVGVRVLAELRADASPSSVPGWLDTLDWRRWTWRLVPVAAALALGVAGVAQTPTPGENLEEVVVTERPVSSALVTGEVAGGDLLSLLLSSNADATLTTTTGGGQ
jgi:anti-sigma factor RsiW